jgi:hypothetical protein
LIGFDGIDLGKPRLATSQNFACSGQPVRLQMCKSHYNQHGSNAVEKPAAILLAEKSDSCPTRRIGAMPKLVKQGSKHRGAKMSLDLRTLAASL